MSTLNVKDSSGNWKEIPSIGGYTKDEVNAMLGGKANEKHTHTISDVNSLQSVLDSSMKTYTLLLDTSSQGMTGTKTLSDSIMNYKYIIVMVQAGVSCSLVPMMCPSIFIKQRNYDSSTKLVMCTDALYYSIYFPSETSITLNDSNLGNQSQKKMVIYGIN